MGGATVRSNAGPPGDQLLNLAADGAAISGTGWTRRVWSRATAGDTMATPPMRRCDGRACNYCQKRRRSSVAYTVGGFNWTPADPETRSAPRGRGPGRNRSHRRLGVFNNRLSNYCERLWLLAIRTDVSVCGMPQLPSSFGGW